MPASWNERSAPSPDWVEGTYPPPGFEIYVAFGGGAVIPVVQDPGNVIWAERVAVPLGGTERTAAAPAMTERTA